MGSELQGTAWLDLAFFIHLFFFLHEEMASVGAGAEL